MCLSYRARPAPLRRRRGTGGCLLGVLRLVLCHVRRDRADDRGLDRLQRLVHQPVQHPVLGRIFIGRGAVDNGRRGAAERALEAGQLLQRLVLLRGDQHVGGHEAQGGGGADGDPRVFPGPLDGVGALAEAGRELLERACDGVLGELRLLLEELGLAQLTGVGRRCRRARWRAGGRRGRSRRVGVACGVHTSSPLPSWTTRSGATRGNTRRHRCPAAARVRR